VGAVRELPLLITVSIRRFHLPLMTFFPFGEGGATHCPLLATVNISVQEIVAKFSMGVVVGEESLIVGQSWIE
jgi:hypothetical protein